MTEILAVAVKEAKSLVRDPGALVMLFVLPGIFIVIMSVALQGAFATDETGETLAVLFVDQSGRDGASFGQEVAEAFEQSRRFRLVTELDGEPVDRASAERYIKRGTYRMGVVIPEDIGRAVALEQRSTVTVLVDPTLSRAYAVAVQGLVEGVAHARIITRLVDQAEELGDRAEEASAAVDQLKTKLTEASDGVEQCVDNLEKAEKTINMLDGKLRSIRSKLRAAGLPTGSWPAELSSGPDGKGGGKEGGKEGGRPTSTSHRDAGPTEADAGPTEADAWPLSGDAGPPSGDAAPLSGDAGPSRGDAGSGEPVVGERERGIVVEQSYVSSTGGPTPNSVQQSVPGWTIFALFWIVQILAVNMIRERLSGAFRRILISPMALWKYVVGATVPFFVVNLLQAVVMFSLGIWLLPLLGCPRLMVTNLGALAAVTAAVSASAMALGLLMASMSQSVFFAASASAILITIMAILGGIMVPRIIMPGYMQQMGFLVPHGWALDGYLDVLVRGESVGDVLDTVGVLLGFALGFFVVAVIRLRQLARTK